MKLARRAMLRLLGAGGLTVAWPFERVFFAGEPVAPDAQAFFLIFDDVTIDTPVEALESLLAPFSALGIPVGFIVKPGDPADTPAEKAAPLATFLHGFLYQSPDLGEIIAWQPDLAQGQPYVQIRNATDTRAHLAAFLDPSAGGTFAPYAPLTIAGEDRAGNLAVDAVRAAGFRNVMLLSQKADVSVSGRCVQTTACMRGSLRHSISEGGYDIMTAVRAAMGTGDMIVLALSLATIADIHPETLRTRAATLADAIGADLQTGRIFAALPKEHAFWFSTGSARLIGLVIDTPPQNDPVAQAGFDALKATLTDAGMPFSLMTRAPDPITADRSLCQIVALPLRFAPGADACAIADRLPALVLRQLADAGVAAIVEPAVSGTTGLDENGLLHLPGIPISGFGQRNPDPARDIVLTIPATAYATGAQRLAILGTLRDATKGSASVILNIPDVTKAVLPDDPVYRLMLATRRDMAVAPAPLPPPDPRAILIEDAEIAWSYFDRMTDATTGLCASTVFFDGAWSSINRALTMWDYGSLIQATMASHELGLIDDGQYLQRATAILHGLPSEKIGGLMLPSSEIASDSGKSLSRDYNACDTGRLLIALDQMNRHPLSKGLFTQKVAAWNLGDTLRDGQLNSITQGRLRPLFQSHCTHYAARAFGQWGIAARSPYEAGPKDSKTDARMRLLYEVAQIGAIGAEPLLLEAVELGFSAPSAYLADVLFAAQARSFAATGNLVCVSEGPMDRAPWFSYQGLRVDADRDIWDVQPIDPAATYQTSDFRAAAQVISTKAAFLWAALRPATYSFLLLDHVRRHARASTVGYSSGTYVATGTAMTNYTDINTNAVILQAIAHSLRGAVAVPSVAHDERQVCGPRGCQGENRASGRLN
ncbi:MAG: DUF3131 domain-containing protein [Paracoccaceae bacterium]|nr:DUF3131 domain-containing protein [Paracoccaceae bacterium]